MTRAEFDIYTETSTMPRNWIGQGYGYKDTEYDWDNGDPDDIIYIPEYGYSYYEGCAEYDGYSKNDFLDLVGGDNELAREMFNSVDWQFPETWLDEYERESA